MLALAGSSALGLSLGISVAIVVLMLAVGLSYRQLIRAYPHGGGSYIVADRNLGEFPALIAAAGLLIDYVLTVAVSISAGVAAITSAIPGLSDASVALGLAAIAILLVGNLRGVREAGALFSAPTYAFVLGIAMLIAVGLVDASTTGFAPTPTNTVEPIEGLTVLLVLRAFSSGATAMTGIEAISNAVPAFKPPSARNARTVLTVMVGLLIAMFAGLVVLMHLDGIVPRPGQTAVSQLAHHSFGSGPLYGYVQVTTALVLLLAANTAFNGFPRLLSFMARNGHAPRACLRLGDRLAFSNGTLALALAAAALLAVFGGRTSALIPLYAVGVFVAFTLSQAGMVVHWSRQREQHWRKSMLINAVGAALSAIVFVIAAVTKFSQGAWVAIALMGLLVLLAWRIRRHYDSVRDALSLYPLDPSTPPDPSLLAPRPRQQRRPLAHAPAGRGGREPGSATAPGGRADRPPGSVRPARPGLRRLTGPARAGGAHQPGRGRGSALQALLGRVGRSPAARDRRLALPRARRAAGVLHRRVAHPTILAHAHRRLARADRQTPLAPAPAQRHRTKAPTRPATPTRSRDHHHPPSPADVSLAGPVLHRFEDLGRVLLDARVAVHGSQPSGRVSPNGSATANAARPLAPSRARELTWRTWPSTVWAGSAGRR